MSDQTVLLPKWFSHEGIILAKAQFDHLYTFFNYSLLSYLAQSQILVISLYLPISKILICKCNKILKIFISLYWYFPITIPNT